ncbi:hypothetical protein [Bradyrhizobium valentinum]|uniref:hypothetical protein n=1 Tax=Bradyrhizobium valentinum TaxID=1518501 RepID=UPI000AB1B162|nr:hypothetical protein [Bradyrhizobium valentinum]
MPNGRKLVTLRDAATYITELPKAESALMLVADLGGPTMFARIGLMWALNRHHVRKFNPARKERHWGRRKLKRDRL